MAEIHHFEDAETGRSEEVKTSDMKGGVVDVDIRGQATEVGRSKGQFVEHVEITNTGSFHEHIPEMGRKASSDQDTPRGTWGQRMVAQWQKAGLIGEYGDMSQDSPEYARTLRKQTEASLFPVEEAKPADAA